LSRIGGRFSNLISIKLLSFSFNTFVSEDFALRSYKEPEGAMKKYLNLLVIILAGCTTLKPQITSPGLEYKQDGSKVSLDVAEIQIVNAYQAPANADEGLLPGSAATAIEEWAKTRFVATGSKGTAIIKIINAGIHEQNLVKPEDVHMLLNPEEKPMEYGVNLAVEISVQDTPAYQEGKVNVSLSRHITLDSDVVLGFNPAIWDAFMDNLINSLDHQAQIDLKIYLPNLLTTNETGASDA
jgi:hypothetical protein